jgi:hypothetical protein
LHIAESSAAKPTAKSRKYANGADLVQYRRQKTIMSNGICVYVIFVKYIASNSTIANSPHMPNGIYFEAARILQAHHL